ncbi:hypothetical protein [Staphylococcus haemolyticus]|uniref:hypothetical protein n=1 Tax=Staphylococcus haemolyticus TaxID=1283 RepID=UPI0010FBF9B9|nr:hypothetical protein [Staphylococcus haemolyticus]MBW5900678.1 hypothetical protein [Staphylococcus haemolyticus]QCT49492.1 hypothetical protein EU512_08930 [Staphylococcus haemolyticus]
MKKNQRTEWIGLWYQGEGSGIYTSKHYKKKDFINLLSQDKRPGLRIVLTFNKYWKEGRNTPKFVMCLGGSEFVSKALEEPKTIQIEEDIETEKVIKLEDAIEVARANLYEGASIDDAVVNVEVDMESYAFEVNV